MSDFWLIASLHSRDLLKGLLSPFALMVVMSMDIVCRLGDAEWVQKVGTPNYLCIALYTIYMKRR